MAERETRDDTVERIARTITARRDALGDFTEAIGRELNYCLKQWHWKDQTGFETESWQIQPTGRQLLQTVIHMAAQVSRAELYLDVRPVDRYGDPDKAERVRQLLEQEFYSPRKMYHLLRDRLALFALAGRAWGLKASFDPDIGPYGEVLFNEVDARHLFFAKGYFTPHDPKCPWLAEIVPMDRDALALMRDHDWDVEGLIEDAKSFDPPLNPSADLLSTGPTSEQGIFDDRIEIALFWERNLKQRVTQELRYTKLHKDMRFMQCGKRAEMGCGFKSQPQWQARRILPERDMGMCPTCGGDLYRVDATVMEEDRLAYPDGRLTVLAPEQNKLIYQGGWPERTRSFPYLWFAVRDFPHEPMGQSVTSEMWTRQSGLDIMDRMAMEQMALAKPIFAAPDGDALVDYTKRPWYGGDDQGVWAFYKTEIGRSGIEMHQPNGIPNAWSTVRGSFNADFRNDQGTNDMSLDPGQSRNIPVGTIQALERIRELPIELVIEHLRWNESIFVGCAWDIMRQRYTDQRMYRLAGPDGKDYVQAIRASDLPDMDIQITASPSLSRMNADQVKTADYVAQLPPARRRFVAKALNVPVSILRDLERDEAIQAQQAAAATAQGGQAGPRGPVPLPPTGPGGQAQQVAM